MFLLREIKEEQPEIKTMLGGPGPYNGIDIDSKNMYRLQKKCSFVDKIIFGEGELVLKKYVEEGHEGKKIISAKDFGRGPLDMNSLPYLDYSNFELDKYFILVWDHHEVAPLNVFFVQKQKYGAISEKCQLKNLLIMSKCS